MKIRLKINKITFLVILGIVCLSFYMQTQPETIIWNKDRPLTWDDYKAQFTTITENAATTSSGIKWRTKTKKDSLTVTIEALMYPLSSRIKIELRSYSLLKHEQLHFDITELYARKLRQVILAQKLLNKKNLSAQLNPLVAINDKLLDQYQNQYDLEIRQNKNKQLEWEKRVASELKALDMFSNTEVKLLLK